MAELSARETRRLECSVSSNAMAGELESGDRHIVCNFPHGALVAVMDGLGHGPIAGEASDIAARVFEANPQESIEALIVLCHEALKQTRGVAITLASVDFRNDTLTWLGVGNVEGRVLRAFPTAQRPGEWVLLRGGIVGYRLPQIRASTVPIDVGDLLIMATDGIGVQFSETVDVTASTQSIADAIMHNFRKLDDALVLVARYEKVDP